MAVDLHLLKQALEAKHFTHWQVLFEELEKSYEKELGKDKARKVFERITSVEHRGRYRH
jgi:tRNA A-37 threonylcarbamoyl transferase component Bud32